ncbi:hypoxanthine phosphoribosyltransferase [Hyphomicrobium sp.]|uniref:hypoxanthine phosphoribosyltransferase n=1 Tax=Hyphomicrobium sp. TaxID=82 RepID=UPI002D78F328|nr:hypoxanthine phosphoribosyltransferase [Hyphomicrobium sp.]HET6389631.1 hypoxanthine phosphoribosyltransferase [Hyphomicrobium sp.]
MPDLNAEQTVETIFSAEDIQARLQVLAAQIAGKAPKNLLVVPVLKGSFVFAADLLRALYAAGVSPEVDFLTLSSYRKRKESAGQVTILRDLDLDVQNRHVILIDDVLDSGRTLAFAKDLIAARGATRIETCVLLDKKAPRAVSIEPDYCAFECENVFVVGYGMDVAHRYRELPFVGRLVD